TLELDGIEVGEIVSRVKCETAVALHEAFKKYPPERFRWFMSWTAKVDLTLDTNELGVVTPTALYYDPFTTAALPGVGSFTRNFTLGFGTQISTTANRNDKMSFTISIKELQDPSYRGTCDFPRGRGLLGNLGLREWIEAALVPVGESQLTIGYHE